MPRNCSRSPTKVEPLTPVAGPSVRDLIPEEQNKLFDIKKLINALVDADSFLEIKTRFAKEVVTGLARLGGEVIGIVANNSRHKGGVLFPDSADKSARFITLCDAFNIPLLYLADVPGFMIGSKVEREGIIRHGAKMISAMSNASVPSISVVVRKAYGAGFHAMCGPGFEPDCTLALWCNDRCHGTASAVNAVYAKKIAEAPEEERDELVQRLRNEYAEDVDLTKLVSELIVDHIVEPENLRGELIARFGYYREAYRTPSSRKHGVTPV